LIRRGVRLSIRMVVSLSIRRVVRRPAKTVV
jgi:hypothetical protein